MQRTKTEIIERKLKPLFWDYVVDPAEAYDVLMGRRRQAGPFDRERLLIRSNKLGALLRFEPKDYADLWVIAGHRSFSWKDIVDEARTKEAGLDPVMLYDLMRSFPREMLPTIRWAIEVDNE